MPARYQENVVIILSKKESDDGEITEFKKENEVMVNHPIFYKSATILQSLHLQNTIILLTIIESLFILGEIVISVLHKPECPIAEAHAGDKYHENGYYIILTVEKTIFWGSFILLCCFSLEHIMKLIIFGHKYFMRNLWCVVDFIMVGLSLWLAFGYHLSTADDFLWFLIVFRFWRILHNFSIIIIVMKKQFKKKLDKLKDEIEFLKDIIASKNEIDSKLKADPQHRAARSFSSCSDSTLSVHEDKYQSPIW
jgi:hypothetical protein